MRSGTINVNGIAAMGEAIRHHFTDFEAKIERIRELKDYVSSALLRMEDVKLNSQTGKDSAPHIVSASFKGLRAEVLLHALEEKGIYVSAGSACSSRHPGISGTLKGIGLPEAYLGGSIRISFSEFNTMEEAVYFVEVLEELLPRLRKFSGK